MSRHVLIPVAAALVASSLGALGFAWPLGKGKSELRLPGTVETQEVHLGSKVGGRVARVEVEEGELVEPWRVLVVLDVPELDARIDAARAQLEAAKAELAKAEAGPREQEKVAARAAAGAARARFEWIQAGPRVEEIEQARGALQAAEADRKVAERDRSRVVGLTGRGFATDEARDAMAANVGRHAGRARAARAALDLLLAGSRPEQVAEAQATLDQAQAQADLLEQGTRPEDLAAARARVAELQANLAELEAQRKEATIVAPERVVVEAVAVRAGDLVAPNQPAVRVLRAADLWVMAYVPETELGKVQLNQEVDVTVDSHPDLPFAGRVVQIAAVSEFTPRNVQSRDERRHQVFGVKVRIADPRGVFKSGMAAEVILPLDDQP